MEKREHRGFGEPRERQGLAASPEGHSFPLRALQFLCALGMLVSSVPACMTPGQRREDDLVRDARMFNDDFRWGRWDILGQSMTPEENALFQARKNLVDTDLVIVDYEVTAVRFMEKSEAATVDVKLEWYKKSDPTVRQATLQQRWELRAGRWMMIKQRRSRGDRFPLVPEPAGEKTAADKVAPLESKPGAP